MRGGGGGGLFNLAKMMVLFLYKETKNKVENLKYKMLQVMPMLCSQGSKTNLHFQLVNKPSWVSPHKRLQSRLINAVYLQLIYK